MTPRIPFPSMPLQRHACDPAQRVGRIEGHLKLSVGFVFFFESPPGNLSTVHPTLPQGLTGIVIAGVPGSKEFAGQFIPPPSRFHVSQPIGVERRRLRRGQALGHHVSHLQQALGHQARLYQRQSAEQFEFEVSEGVDTGPSLIFLKTQGTQWQPGDRLDPIAQGAQPQPQELERGIQVALRSPPERQEPRPMPHR